MTEGCNESKVLTDTQLIISTIKAREARAEKRYLELKEELRHLRDEMSGWSQIINDDLKDSVRACNEAVKKAKTANRIYRKLEVMLRP